MPVVGELKIDGLDSLFANLKAKEVESRQRDQVCVIVGYSAPYATYVHEAVGMVLKGKPRPSGIGTYWSPHGQAKFLEQPFRMMMGQIYTGVLQKVAAGMSMLQAMLIEGEKLQHVSENLVPIEYTTLIGSSFTKQDENWHG